MDIFLKNIVKAYGRSVVLNIDQFNFNHGKIYGIIGPNGAGKSTLLKIIGNMEKSSKGKVLYNGFESSDSIIKGMTYLTQKPYLFNTTVFNNIAAPLKFRKCTNSKINSTVNRIMDELEIKELALQNATSLSGGEAQKVALARALVFEPQILLLDEPTSNIDPNAIEIIEKIILKTNREKKTTILLITHNVAQAKRVCDELIFLNKGCILESGKAKDVIFNPKTQEAKRYLSLEYYIS